MAHQVTLPWSRRSVFVQLGLVAGAAVYAAVILVLVSWPLAVVFAALCAGWVLLNHWLVCRDCQYHGTLCGSFGLGRLALFRRTGKEHFDERTARLSMAVFWCAALFPALAVVVRPSWWWLAAIYLALAGASGLVHSRLGCARCPLVHCSANPGFIKARCV